MFTYVIIKSNIDFVYSQLKFILDFSDDSAVFGQTGIFPWESILRPKDTAFLCFSPHW